MVRATLLASLLVASLWAQDKNEGFTGVLLDAPCAASIGIKGTSTTAAAQTAGSPNSTRDTPRYTRGDLIPCQATITTTSFALLTPEGKTIHFDSQTNDKLVMQVESDQQWKDALNSVSGSPHDSISSADSKIKPPENNSAERRRTGGKDITGSGATTKQGTARQVEVRGRMENDKLRGDTIKLAAVDKSH